MMKKAFVFPGQGAQKVGMVKDLYDAYPVVKQLFEEADDALGFSLTKLCFEGPDEELMKTYNTQPAILTASTACCRVLAQEGLTPDIAAGHSLGEYSALVAAGSLTFADAVRTVRLRGQFMQEAVPLGEGGMAAILGLDEDKIKEAGLTPYYVDGTVAFEEAKMIFVCKKVYVQRMGEANFVEKANLDKWYADKDMHNMYMGEIKKILVKED